ncbi:MAG: hypothetical protein GC203_10150 [Phenylobacterium sp.]|uniref:hypothetical protein n=1 Tax=Phenylobacterium sp. TaxID=1871053 RepID=UPI0025CD24A5|nr:hypothetical protein [Phenylobacterium sp.]MBI1198212.1 hypothetical protein [Phenylobacterium sp.]
MVRIPLLGVLAATALVSACAPTLGPPPPSAPPPPPISTTAEFNAQDFAWSQKAGANVIAGRVMYREGAVRFTCAGSTVVLTPETPWSRRRMAALYGSGDHAALPVADVRARTASAPPGDANPYVKRTTCDAADQFAFGGLPDGAWYAITVARPAGSSGGDTLALMRRVVTRGGKIVPLTL